MLSVYRLRFHYEKGREWSNVSFDRMDDIIERSRTAILRNKQTLVTTHLCWVIIISFQCDCFMNAN